MNDSACVLCELSPLPSHVYCLSSFLCVHSSLLYVFSSLLFLLSSLLFLLSSLLLSCSIAGDNGLNRSLFERYADMYTKAKEKTRVAEEACAFTQLEEQYRMVRCDLLHLYVLYSETSVIWHLSTSTFS